MNKYPCKHCNLHEPEDTEEKLPEKGEPDEVFFDRVDPVTELPGTPLDETPEGWSCPDCGKKKEDF